MTAVRRTGSGGCAGHAGHAGYAGYAGYGLSLSLVADSA